MKRISFALTLATSFNLIYSSEHPDPLMIPPITPIIPRNFELKGETLLWIDGTLQGGIRNYSTERYSSDLNAFLFEEHEHEEGKEIVKISALKRDWTKKQVTEVNYRNGV